MAPASHGRILLGYGIDIQELERVLGKAWIWQGLESGMVATRYDDGTPGSKRQEIPGGENAKGTE